MKLKYILLSIFLSIMPAFAQDESGLMVTEQELPELPNAVDVTAQVPEGFFEQYSSYIIVALFAIGLLIVFMALYMMIGRKSKVSFSDGKNASQYTNSQAMTTEECLRGENSLPDAVKSFLIKTNLLP